MTSVTTDETTGGKKGRKATTKHPPSPCPEPMGLRLSPAAGPRRRACSFALPREGPSVHPASGAKIGVEKAKERVKRGERDRHTTKA